VENKRIRSSDDFRENGRLLWSLDIRLMEETTRERSLRRADPLLEVDVQAETRHLLSRNKLEENVNIKITAIFEVVNVFVFLVLEALLLVVVVVIVVTVMQAFISLCRIIRLIDESAK
jgi:hypothetical protein